MSTPWTIKLPPGAVPLLYFAFGVLIVIGIGFVVLIFDFKCSMKPE